MSARSPRLTSAPRRPAAFRPGFAALIGLLDAAVRRPLRFERTHR